ncbi:MAG: AEC family transporter [Butyrivibrio sp.]|uniref:AEC family transporter n=1 Tax=Butyrivibrio sp. TaxID=28121 RepID=UPI001B018DA9|nr:AEC family transporter [Butyrivibrio sp.]MBO6242695.1 AEC family transporter [Butyrivibrio sp.]
MVHTIFFQICTMFVFAACGYIMFKCGKISSAGSKTIGNILIFLSLPCVIIRSFIREKAEGELSGLLISAILALLILTISTFVSSMIFRKRPVEIFAGAYSNPGFFGIPLIISCMSSDVVFYISPFIAFLNVFQWTYGVSVLKGEDRIEKIPLKKVVTAPFFIAICIGMVLYLSSLEMPHFIVKSIASIAEMNTPLAMISVGIYMAQTDFIKMFRKKYLYFVALVRLAVIPLIVLVLMTFMPDNVVFAQMKLALLIAAACPVGSNIAVYADLYDSDRQYAAETVVMSTLLSIVTIPAIVFLFGIIE